MTGQVSWCPQQGALGPGLACARAVWPALPTRLTGGSDTPAPAMVGAPPMAVQEFDAALLRTSLSLCVMPLLRASFLLTLFKSA